MVAPTLVRLIAKLFARPQSRRDRRRAARLGLEALEGRDVPAVTFTVDALSNAAEGGGAGEFRVTANGDAADFTNAVYAIVSLGGTATYSTDYSASQAPNSYMIFNSPGSTATLTVTAVDDTDIEGGETVGLTVQRYQMYPMGPQATGSLTISDNDTAPVTVFADTYGTDDVSVTVTVTQASPESDYLWTYHVTNESLADGLSWFAVPFEDPSMISAPADSLGWGGTLGLPLDSCWVVWEAGAVVPLGLGSSGDFMFTTEPADIALSNALFDTSLALDYVTSPAVFVAAPIPQRGPQPPQQAPHPAVLVTTEFDTDFPGAGANSLRSAIRWTNAFVGPSTPEIRFSMGVIGRPIVLGPNEQFPAITGNVTINGADRAVRVERDLVFAAQVQQPGFRFFEIIPGAKATITGLTLVNGGGIDVAKGGAIYSEGELALRNCVLQNNQAVAGGAVYAEGHSLTLDNCHVFSNRARNGAGVYADTESVLITNSTINFNNGRGMGNVGDGGGVYLGTSVALAAIKNSTLNGNSTNEMGGGLYIAASNGEAASFVHLSGVTITNNVAATGGGIGTNPTGGLTLIIDDQSLIAFNTAASGGGGLNGKGGGIYFGSGTLFVAFTLITFNIADSGAGLYREGGATYVAGTEGFVLLNFWDDVLLGGG